MNPVLGLKLTLSILHKVFQQFDLKLIGQSPADRTMRNQILGTNFCFISKKSKNLMSIWKDNYGPKP